MSEFHSDLNTPAPCPLCGQEPQGVRATMDRTLRHCGACDMVHVPEAEHLAPQKERERYLHHENSLENREYVARFEHLIERLDQFVSRPRRVLDFGCGPAAILVELLRRRGDEVVGYDPFFAPDADLSGVFDAVVSTETFEHFANPRKEVTRICSLLRPGGVLAVMTQLHPGAAAVGEWWYVRDPTHVCFYSRATMDWIAGEFGLELLECDGVRLCLLRKR